MLPVEIFFLLLLVSIIIIIIIRQSKKENTGLRVYDSQLTNSYLELPLYYQDGFYQTRFRLSSSSGGSDAKTGGIFQAIPDTGSRILIIGSQICKDCPKNNGIWNVRNGVNTSGGKKYQIRYNGGQTSTYLPWKGWISPSEKSSEDPRGERERGEKPESAEFGVITNTHIHNSRPQNVMGLMPGNRSFLNSLGESKKVLFDFPNGKLFINPTDKELANYSNMRKKSLKLYLPDADVNYPLVKITDLTISSPDRRTERPVINKPRYAIFDTGTNNVILPEKYYSAIFQKERRDQKHKNGISNAMVNFFFEGLEEPTKIRFPLNLKGQVLSGNLPIAETILIGTVWFDKYILLFDYDEMVLTIFFPEKTGLKS